MDFSKICINCMKEKPDGQSVCPYCGFDISTYEVEPYVLPPFTILNGKYLVGKMIGAGGFGITYLAFDMVLEHRVAVKEFFLSGSVYRNSSLSVTLANVSISQSKMYYIVREKFEKEAKTLAMLDFVPGIVKVYDYFSENNTSYIVMEYLPGMTLKKYIPEHGGKMEWEELREKMLPVMKSLKLLHDSGILHRDISPDNIMVMEKDGSLKLFDFGGVKVQSQEQEKSIVNLVKAGYSPLEQYREKGMHGPWTDIYALAATMYFCLCGKPPLEAPARADGSDKLEIPSSLGVKIPPNAEKALLKALAIMEKDRYQNMTEFIDALAKVRSGGNKEKERKRRERENGEGGEGEKPSFPKALIIVLAVVVIGGAGFWFWNSSQNSDNEPSSEPGTMLAQTTESEEETTEAVTMAQTSESVEETSEATTLAPISEPVEETSEAAEETTESIEETSEAATTEPQAIAVDAQQESAPSVEDNAEIRSGYYIIATAYDSGKLLHIADNSEEEGALLDIWEDSSDMINYQVFYIEKQENGRYKIIADINRLSLDVKDASSASGAYLQMKTYDATEGQQWYLIPSEDGYYYIRNELGTYLDCAWGSMENGTEVNNVDWNGGMNQKWQLYWNGCVDPNGVIRNGTYALATALDSGKRIIPTGESTDERVQLIIGEASDLQREMVTVERQEEGWYKISYSESQLVFDVKDASYESGAFLQQKHYDATEGQHWYFELSDEGNLYIRSEFGTYIDLSESSTEDGTEIKLVDFNGNENQQWNLFPDGKVLKSTTATGSDGVASETIEAGLYQIVSAMDQNKVLRVANDSTEDGATFVLWDSDDSEAERFYVEQFEDGTCKILMNFADKSLDVKDASSESGAVLQQRSYDATEGQQWILQPTDDGYYYICSVLGTCLDCDHASTENGTAVSMFEQTQSENQKWSLRRVG